MFCQAIITSCQKYYLQNNHSAEVRQCTINSSENKELGKTKSSEYNYYYKFSSKNSSSENRELGIELYFFQHYQQLGKQRARNIISIIFFFQQDQQLGKTKSSKYNYYSSNINSSENRELGMKLFFSALSTSRKKRQHMDSKDSQFMFETDYKRAKNLETSF